MSDGETTAAPPPAPRVAGTRCRANRTTSISGTGKSGSRSATGAAQARRTRRCVPELVRAPGLGLRPDPPPGHLRAVVRCTRPAPRVLRSAPQPEEPGTSGRGGRSLRRPSARVPLIAHLSRQGRHRVVRFERRVAVGPIARPAPLPPRSGAASGHPRADHVPIECVAAVQVCPQSGAVLPDRAALFGRANRFVPADDMDLRIARSGTQHLLQCCRGGHVVRSRRRSPVHRGVRPDVQPHQGRVRVLRASRQRRGVECAGGCRRAAGAGAAARCRRQRGRHDRTNRRTPAPTRQHAGSPASGRTSGRHVRRVSTPRRQVVLPARPTPRANRTRGRPPPAQGTDPRGPMDAGLRRRGGGLRRRGSAPARHHDAGDLRTERDSGRDDTLLSTTECAHEPGATQVVWSGSVTKSSALAAQGHVEVVVEAFTPAHSELGITRQQLPIPADAADVVVVRSGRSRSRCPPARPSRSPVRPSSPLRPGSAEAPTPQAWLTTSTSTTEE